jgi:NADPH:quinone reductase
MEKQLENTFVVVENGKYVLKKETISATPAAGEVLVKIAYSTCDPCDGMFSRFFMVEGMRPGQEGCGQIIAVGEGIDPSLVGKKVTFHEEAWGQFRKIKTPSHYLVLDDSQDLKEAAAGYINPLTAFECLERLQSRKSKYYVANAAASALIKMLIKLARAKGGYECIAIVRKEQHARELKEDYGVQNVLI